MSGGRERTVGEIGWADLTVGDAVEVRDFYRQVVGWESAGVEMGADTDHCMVAPGSGDNVAGICHARGMNAGLPPQWLLYVTAANLDESMARRVGLGGEVIAGPRQTGDGARYRVIRDPDGAVAALFQPA